jgi:hypothetical protein
MRYNEVYRDRQEVGMEIKVRASRTRRRVASEPGPTILAEVKRTAISRALVALGYLLVRRRSIPLPFNLKLRVGIS